MTTSNGFAQQAPLYVRALRLHHLHMGGFVSFLLFECMIAAGVLLALAELVSWWAVPVLPAVVAIMVKVNDMVIGGSRRARGQAGTAAHGSSDRASSTRVDSQPPSVPRRTATALDRAEIARGRRAVATPATPATPSSPSSSSSMPSGSGGAGSAGVTTRTVEPPAQRKKVGVIRISVPARDSATARTADTGHGISPASDGAAAMEVAEDVAEEARAHEPGTGADYDEEWTDTDAQGFQRARPVYPGWGDQVGNGTWANHAVEVEQPAAQAWPAQPDDTIGWGGSAWGWGSHAAVEPSSDAQRAAADPQAEWDDETGWADQAAWRSRSSPGWGASSGWDGVSPDYAADYTGEDVGQRTAYDRAAREHAARDHAARGEVYRSGEAHAALDDADDAAGAPGPANNGYARDGHAAAGGSEPANNGYARDSHDGEGRPFNRDAVGGGRHARPQSGGRRPDDSGQFTSGHFTTGRHAERPWRSDDDLARPRTGSFNQGRFA
jgi:hypothetical protein